MLISILVFSISAQSRQIKDSALCLHVILKVMRSISHTLKGSEWSIEQWKFSAWSSIDPYGRLPPNNQPWRKTFIFRSKHQCVSFRRRQVVVKATAINASIESSKLRVYWEPALTGLVTYLASVFNAGIVPALSSRIVCAGCTQVDLDILRL